MIGTTIESRRTFPSGHWYGSRPPCSWCVRPSLKGIALAQADLKGRMHWDEVHEINFVRHTSGKQLFFGGLGGHGIVLKVAGAMIVIADVYDRPLPLIHQLLLYYWEDRGDEERDRVWHFDAQRLE